MNMLDKKVKHNRIKPKVFKDSDYLTWLHTVEQPHCFVCNTVIGISMHHVKNNSTDKRNDDEIIGLCYNHHLGSEFSAHGTVKAFKEGYPIEEQRAYAKKLYNKYLKEN